MVEEVMDLDYSNSHLTNLDIFLNQVYSENQSEYTFLYH